MTAGRNVSLVIALVALALLACWPSVAALWHLWVWNRYVDDHGPIIALISFALLVRSRNAFAAAGLAPCAAGAVGLFACSLAWVISWRAGIQDLHVVLLPLVLFLAVLAAFGKAATQIAAFPIGYLYFAEPVCHVGMPVTITGNVLYFPHSISFEVTPLFSGVNLSGRWSRGSSADRRIAAGVAPPARRAGHVDGVSDGRQQLGSGARDHHRRLYQRDAKRATDTRALVSLAMMTFVGQLDKEKPVGLVLSDAPKDYDATQTGTTVTTPTVALAQCPVTTRIPVPTGRGVSAGFIDGQIFTVRHKIRQSEPRVESSVRTRPIS